MRVLVACEESQRVCIAFRNRGCEAYSCDLQDCSGGHPEWHIKGDVIEHLDNVPMNYYDLIIAHPPCTYLSVAGSMNFSRDPSRYRKMEEAVKFFMYFYNYEKCRRICIENPRDMKICGLPKWDQVIQPYDFGDNYSKQTCLWLKGLPYLFPNCIVYNRRSAAPSWCSLHSSAKIRSRTFTGIAEAMARQWSSLDE